MTCAKALKGVRYFPSNYLETVSAMPSSATWIRTSQKLQDLSLILSLSFQDLSGAFLSRSSSV